MAKRLPNYVFDAVNIPIPMKNVKPVDLTDPAHLRTPEAGESRVKDREGDSL